MSAFYLRPGRLRPADVREALRGTLTTVRIPNRAWAANEAARALVERAVAERWRVYG